MDKKRENPRFAGKRHTEESKRKISSCMSRRFKTIRERLDDSGVTEDDVRRILREDVSETLKIRLLDENAVIPTYAHDGDIGMDVTATSVEYDADLDMYVYHTGISVESKFGVGVFCFLRSSNRRTDAYLCNHVGVADSAIYRGEILFCFKNRTSLEVRAFMEAYRRGISDVESVKAELDPMDYAPYKVGERVGQLVLFRHLRADVVLCETLSDSDRGSGGFGSTGT